METGVKCVEGDSSASPHAESAAHDGAGTTIRVPSVRPRIHAAAAVGAGGDASEPLQLEAVKRLRGNDENLHTDAADESSGAACSVPPAVHPLVSSPVDMMAQARLQAVLQAEVIDLRAKTSKLVEKAAAADARAAAAEAGKAAAEMTVHLYEQDRAVEAMYPAVAALVRTYSQLWRNITDSGRDSPGQHWLQCLIGCPVQPQARCLELLSLLAQLQQAPAPPAFHVFTVNSKPLFDCLEHATAADLAGMQQVAEYLQLPKPLVTRVLQHAAACELRLAHTSPAALPAALQEGPLRLLVDASLASIPNLFIDPEQREKFSEVHPSRDDAVGAKPEALALHEVPDATPTQQHHKLLADPCLLQGLSNAPCTWQPGCDGKQFKSVHLTGLLLAGHPLPAELHLRRSAVAAALFTNNEAAMTRMLQEEFDLEVWQGTALQAAACFGRSEALPWLISDGTDEDSMDGVLECAAAAGQLAALRLLVYLRGELSLEVAAAAAFRGDLPMLQWLRANGCPWDGSTLAQAAAGGHTELLEWAITNGCPKDARACAGAASTGNLPLLRSLRDQGFDWDVRCYIAAAEGGHLNTMRYLREGGCGWGAGNAVCAAAAGAGRRELLQWCREKGAAWGPRTCEGAAAGGHLDVLIYAHKNGCPINERAACAAAKHGHVACLAWIFENDGGRFVHNMILSYAHCSTSECVKLAVAHGCTTLAGTGEPGALGAGEFGDPELAHWLMERAAGSGPAACARVARQICKGAVCGTQLHLLDWMLAAGHLDTGSSELAVAAVDEENPVLVLEWLHEHGVRFDACVFAKAAESSSVALLVWLRDVARCPWDSSACVATVKHTYCAVGTLQWLVEAGCPLSAAVWDSTAAKSVRKWLCVQPVRPWDDKLVLWALRHGDLELAEWALANEPDAAEAVRVRCCAEGIAAGQLVTVKWARSHGGEWTDACVEALSTGSFAMVQHCVNDGCGVSEAMFNYAVSGARRLDMAWQTLWQHLRFLKNANCPWSAATVTAAATAAPSYFCPNAYVVEWLRANGCPIDASTCATAAASLPLVRLQQVRALGCPIDGTACIAAAEAGRLDALQWAYGQGCPLDGCADIVVQSAPVREWLGAQGVACRPN